MSKKYILEIVNKKFYLTIDGICLGENNRLLCRAIKAKLGKYPLFNRHLLPKDTGSIEILYIKNFCLSYFCLRALQKKVPLNFKEEFGEDFSIKDIVDIYQARYKILTNKN